MHFIVVFCERDSSFENYLEPFESMRNQQLLCASSQNQPNLGEISMTRKRAKFPVPLVYNHSSTVTLTQSVSRARDQNRHLSRNKLPDALLLKNLPEGLNAQIPFCNFTNGKIK
jgi:hypothetical protein